MFLSLENAKGGGCVHVDQNEVDQEDQAPVEKEGDNAIGIVNAVRQGGVIKVAKQESEGLLKGQNGAAEGKVAVAKVVVQGEGISNDDKQEDENEVGEIFCCFSEGGGDEGGLGVETEIFEETEDHNDDQE